MWLCKHCIPWIGYVDGVGLTGTWPSTRSVCTVLMIDVVGDAIALCLCWRRHHNCVS